MVKNDILERMVRPPRLSGDAPLTWSYGTGNQVWEIITACITGDLEVVEKMITSNPELVKAHVEYFTPLHFAVREGHIALVHYLLDHGADTIQTGGDSLVTIATDRGYAELAALFDSIQKDKYHIKPE